MCLHLLFIPCFESYQILFDFNYHLRHLLWVEIFAIQSLYGGKLYPTFPISVVALCLFIP